MATMPIKQENELDNCMRDFAKTRSEDRRRQVENPTESLRCSGADPRDGIYWMAARPFRRSRLPGF